jgi:hypothetical protein
VAKSATNGGGLLTPWKLAVELIGFLIGLGLLAWCVKVAIEQGDWSRLRQAGPWQITGLLGCSAVSLLVNGAAFWITIRPVRALRLWDLERLNCVGTMLNYAPIRAGAIARVAYHLRVDRLGLLEIGAWFTMLGYILLLGVGSCVLATLAHPEIDWLWAVLVIGQMMLGAAIARVAVGHRLIVRHGRGIDRMLRDPMSLWGASLLRLVDIAAFTGRMGAAISILGLSLPGSHLVMLALVALAASLIPFGRLGFREWAVALAAARLTAFGTDPGSIESFASLEAWTQLALVESAGEASVVIPAGAVALLWYRHRWRRGGGAADDSNAGSESPAGQAD